MTRSASTPRLRLSQAWFAALMLASGSHVLTAASLALPYVLIDFARAAREAGVHPTLRVLP
jgi:hypothetical protein